MFRESAFQNRATLKWEPQESKKTGILLLHGYAEHSRRYRTFGDRMAGLLACHVTLDRQDKIAALMLSGPLLDTPSGIPNIVKKIGRVVSKIIPIMPVVALDIEGLCREPDVIRRYMADPLVYTGKIRARTGIELEDAVFAMRERFMEFTVPMWVGHGTLDRLAMPAGSRYLLDVAPSADKEYKAYNGLYHEILNEPESEVVLHDMTFWLKKRFK